MSTAERILRRSGAILTDDHFVLASGRHSASYIAKQKALVNPEDGWILAGTIAAHPEVSSQIVETVIGPVAGAVSLAYLTALRIGHLKVGFPGAIYAEKGEGETYYIKSEFEDEVRDKCVLVVEDILTTGGSALKVINAVRAMGGEVVGLAAICNRSGITPQQAGNVPFIVSLTEITLDSWDEAECELCKSGVPVNQIYGRGKEFLAGKTAN